VGAKQKALIITDGTESIMSIAKTISDELADFSVSICHAEKFDGTDLLSAELFFLGCENSGPSSFAYIEEMLSHINLASRKCGVFSVNEKPLEYLRCILKDSEADFGEPLFITDANNHADNVKAWIREKSLTGR
jgi:hypothetical protein